MKKKKNSTNKYNLSERDLLIYNYFSTVLGIFAIAISPTGVFGIILGLLGLCLSLTYYEIKKKITLGYILCIIGSLASTVFLAYTIYFAWFAKV
jgi:hypothetical protein